ncbi:hypothetical protein ACF1AY_04810 [Streptomyces sp. NPDC014776]|uniref:hypothetical protein n=1 Tax=Streptomyces sp. NPDC014776 TaxID=3364909 RepID=UPI003700CA76
MTADLRTLLETVLDALTLPPDTPDYDRRILDRAALARVTAREALAEDAENRAQSIGYLKRKLALEEQDAAERENNRCRRCHKPFDPTDDGYAGRGRYGSTPWCRSCISNCRDGSAEHLCVICEPARYGGARK